MVDDRPENQGSLPESERPKREPPTIDLEATEVTSETATASAKPQAAEGKRSAEAHPKPQLEAPAAEPASQPVPPSAPVSPWIVAPVSGAVAAALVIGVGWMLGWPAIQPAATPPAPQLNAAAIDDLTGRIAGLETKISKPAAPAWPIPLPWRGWRRWKNRSPRCAANSQPRARKAKNLPAAINEVKSAPRADGTPAPDLSGINEQIAKIESAVRAQAAEIAAASQQDRQRQAGRSETCGRSAAAPGGGGGPARCSRPHRRSLSGGARRGEDAGAQCRCAEAARSSLRRPACRTPASSRANC